MMLAISFIILFGMLAWSLYTIETTLKCISSALNSIVLHLIGFNKTDLFKIELDSIGAELRFIRDEVEKITGILEKKEFLEE